MGTEAKTLRTSYTTITWTADGNVVQKARDPAHDARRRFRYELRVNKLLRDEPPPVPAPRLLSHDVQERLLVFEAVPGDPLGPKYPHDLDPDQMDAMIDLADRLHHFEPRRRRWFRRLDTSSRLRQAVRHDLLSAGQAERLLDLGQRFHTTYRFGHGDITARNVLQTSTAAPHVLIDWEWAGLYPAGYDHAFLWFSLVDTPGGRERVEQHMPAAEPAFLLSALLVQLWHLQWFTPAVFRAKHLETRDQLLRRLGA